MGQENDNVPSAAFHAKLRELTSGIESSDQYMLFVNLPLSMGLDSADVEWWIVYCWKERLHRGNVIDAARKFRSFYRETEGLPLFRGVVPWNT